MNRYSARLLFSYKQKDRQATSARIVEIRTITFFSANIVKCREFINEYAAAFSYKFDNTDSGEVHFQFEGVIDILDLTIVAEAIETWYDIDELSDADIANTVKDLSVMEAIGDRRSPTSHLPCDAATDTSARVVGFGPTGDVAEL